MEEYIPMVTSFGIRVLGVLAIVAAAWFVSAFVKRMLNRRFKKMGFDETLGFFISSIVYWLILLLGGLSALSIFGVQTTSFAAVLGSAGLAIGLAMQGSLSNLAAGAMILIFRPFKNGQVIKVAGVTGKVTTIGLFTTELDTPQNIRIIVPNSSVFGSIIENYGYHDTRRADIAVGTDYGADLEQTRAVLLSAIEEVEGRLEDGNHNVVLTGLGASSIDWSVRIWASSDKYWGVMERANVVIKNKLDEAGIGIPFPQMDVHLEKVCKD